jgi:hypothetical protein
VRFSSPQRTPWPLLCLPLLGTFVLQETDFLTKLLRNHAPRATHALSTRPLTGARAPERQSARAGGPRGRADRAKSTSRRTYGARNFPVSEFSPAAQSLETSGFCRSDAVTSQPPPGPPAPSSGRCADCLKGGTGRAPHRAPQAEPGADCPVRSRCRSETMRPRLVRLWCVQRRARIPPCSARQEKRWRYRGRG